MSYLEVMCVRGGLSLMFKFFDRLALDSILNVAGASRTLHIDALVYLAYRFDVDKLLENWVDHGPDLRRCFLDTGAIAVGSAPLRFLQRVQTHNSTHALDLCVELGGAFTLGKHILSQGYRYCTPRYGPISFAQSLQRTPTLARLHRSGNPRAYIRSPVLQVFRFKRDNMRRKPYRQLNIIVVCIPPARHILNFGESKL